MHLVWATEGTYKGRARWETLFRAMTLGPGIFDLKPREPIARPPERRGRHRVWSADSARGWDLLPAGLLDSSVLQVLAHARARTCPGSPTRVLAGRGRAVVLAA